jgi:hypothetical protein
MADILLSNDDLTVFGGPETISLDLDFGPTGDRGSIILGVQGDPRQTSVANTISQDVQALDIAIDYSPSSETYKTVFQNVVQPSGNPQWVELVSLKSNFYSETKGPLTPVDGKITVAPINLSDIYDLSEGTVTSSRFSVQYSISSSESAGPLATNLIIKDLNTTQNFVALPLEIEGIEYLEGAWVPITGPKYVHLFITVV